MPRCIRGLRAVAWQGWPEPLGVTPRAGGVNVAVVRAGCGGCGLLPVRRRRARKNSRAHCAAGAQRRCVARASSAASAPGARYGLRARRPFEPRIGHRFDAAEAARSIPTRARLDRPFALHAALFDAGADAGCRADSAFAMPKAVGVRGVPPPGCRRQRGLGTRSIYELHVRGFTHAASRACREALRGTFAGLAASGRDRASARARRDACGADARAPRGIDERHLPALGLRNYWNYTIRWRCCAPIRGSAPGGMAEVRARGRRRCTRRASSVILDVVLNHTGESDELGPTLSLRGLDECGRIHRVDASRRATSTTRAAATRWRSTGPGRCGWRWTRCATGRMHAGVDGFRLRPRHHAGAARRRASTPQRRCWRDRGRTRCCASASSSPSPGISAPAATSSGAFPAGWGEWNDRFRDDVRRFWRGDAGIAAAQLATRLGGLRRRVRRAAAARSVNYVDRARRLHAAPIWSAMRSKPQRGRTARTIATEPAKLFLEPRASRARRDDAALARARAARRAQRCSLTLLAARGAPMLAMGDEAGARQRGNNNAYAQDNALSWFDWSAMDQALCSFTARLVQARLAHPALHAARVLSDAEAQWLRPMAARCRRRIGITAARWCCCCARARIAWRWR
jgi:glycogen operon protein